MAIKYLYCNIENVLHTYITKVGITMSEDVSDKNEEDCFMFYSKTCVKQPLKLDNIKILMINGSLMKVESIAECSPLTALNIIGLENQFLVFLRVAVLHRFYYLYMSLCKSCGPWCGANLWPQGHNLIKPRRE